MTESDGRPGTRQNAGDPLHGVTLEMMLKKLVEIYGWAGLAKMIKLNCLSNDPSIKSSLNFLRKTAWARAKVEAQYLAYIRARAKKLRKAEARTAPAAGPSSTKGAAGRPDILLLNPPLLWGQEERMDLKPPLNLMYLASWLKHHGHTAPLVDAVSLGLSFENVLERIASLAPRRLGVPFYQGSRETAVRLCREAKKLLPKLLIIGGGPLMTTFSEDLMLEHCIDAGVIGEGELTLTELLETPDRGDWPGIPGLALRDAAGNVFKTPPRAPIEPLDSLPFLDTDQPDLQPYYKFHEKLGMPRWLFLSSSRGCPFRCVFCATPVLWPGPMRRLSVPRLIEEIRFHRRDDPTLGIGFMDDSFFSDKRWLNEFLSAIAPENLRYCCIGRADHLDAQEAEKLAKTGCHYVALGVETANQARQKTIRKFLDLDKVEATVRSLSANGILTKCFFMLGFPGETPAEMAETINFAVTLRKAGMSECNFFPVSIYPGTELATGCSASAFTSGIYAGYDRENKPISAFDAEARGEKRLSIYANIPTADINEFLTHAQLLSLVKTAYVKVEKAESITPEEVLAISAK